MSLTKRFRKSFSKPSRTQQSFKQECDVNVIVKRFMRNAKVDLLSKVNQAAGGQYGDFSNVPDYHAAIAQIKRADELFMAMPAVLRKRFDNDAGAFLSFVEDPKNLPELRKMGLAKPEPKVVEPPKEA